MMKRVAVLGVVVHDGKLLCVKHKSYNKPRIEDFWCIPGGGVDDNEALQDALNREMIEETDIKPDIGGLLYIQQFKDSEREHLEFFFHITNPKDYLNIDLSKSTHGEIEIAKIDFIDPSKNNILPKFLMTGSLENLSNQPTKIFSYL